MNTEQRVTRMAAQTSKRPREACPRQLERGASAGAILIADTEPLRRAALRDVTGSVMPGAPAVEVETARETIGQLSNHRYGLACIDLGVLGLADAIEDALRVAADTPLIVLCDAASAALVKHLVRERSAIGIVSKSESVRGLRSIIQLVLAGARCVPDTPTAERSGHSAATQKLTRRQREVLEGLALGQTTARLAHDLRISEAMVKAHIRNACDALGARNRVMAVWIAERRGLLLATDTRLTHSAA